MSWIFLLVILSYRFLSGRQKQPSFSIFPKMPLVYSKHGMIWYVGHIGPWNQNITFEGFTCPKRSDMRTEAMDIIIYDGCWLLSKREWVRHIVSQSSIYVIEKEGMIWWPYKCLNITNNYLVQMKADQRYIKWALGNWWKNQGRGVSELLLN